MSKSKVKLNQSTVTLDLGHWTLDLSAAGDVAAGKCTRCFLRGGVGE